MKITLTLEGQKVGFLEYEIINEFELMGQLGAIVTSPMHLARAIERRIKRNEDITVSGGLNPKDLSKYFDGVAMVLDKLTEEIAGFEYLIPPEENPYLEETPENIQRRVH